MGSGFGVAKFGKRRGAIVAGEVRTGKAPAARARIEWKDSRGAWRTILADAAGRFSFVALAGSPVTLLATGAAEVVVDAGTEEGEQLDVDPVRVALPERRQAYLVLRQLLWLRVS